MSLSAETVKIIKSTVPVLKEHGETIIKTFYKRILTNYPELKNVFNMTNQVSGRQPAILAHTVYAAAVNIEHLELILPAIQEGLHKHVSLGVTPEQYSIVGENLLAAIKETLGDAATDDIINAWAEAYGIIANIFITLEKDLYKKSKEKEGGWEGFIPFTVISKQMSSDSSMSLELKPKHSKTLIVYDAGQYVSVRAIIDGEEFMHHRQYSISKKYDGHTLKITAKKDGKVSSWLMDKVQVGDDLLITPPAGPFHRKSGASHVFIAGGIGVTPLLAMAEEAVEAKENVEFLYFVRSADEAHLLNELSDLARSQTMKLTLISDDASIKNAKKGRVSAEFFKTNGLVSADSVYYTCGGKGFMTSVIESLNNAGVSDAQIRSEAFGPSLVIVSKSE